MAEITNFLEVSSPSGDFTKITNELAVLASVRNILQTPKNARLFLPDFGVDLYSYIFEPLDDITLRTLEQEVYDSILKWENRITIHELYLTQNEADNSISINIKFSYNGKLVEDMIPINTDVYEEVSTSFTLPGLEEQIENLATS